MAGQATAAAAAARGGGEETPAAGTAGIPATIAVTARVADAETLCPAAVIIARAVEAVLSGSSSALGGDGGSATASKVTTPASEGVRMVGAGGEKSADFVAEGGEGSQEERDRYREILEGLGKAHVALGKAVESAAESTCAPAATDDAATAAVEGHEPPEVLPIDERVLPSASQWQFRCSTGGTVETKVNKQEEEENEEENEGLQQVRDLPQVSSLSFVGAGVRCHRGHSTPAGNTQTV